MDFLQWLSVIGLSAFKVIPGLALAIAYNMHPIEIFICLSIGGMLGTTFFTLFAVRIRQWRKRRRVRKVQEFRELQLEKLDEGITPPAPAGIAKPSRFERRMNKPVNIRKARRTKRLWNKVGIIGIALITPPIISPPVGALISVFFGERLKRIFLFMFLSTLLWAAIFALLGHQILELLYDDPAAAATLF